MSNKWDWQKITAMSVLLVVGGFAGLCISGYFDLDRKAQANEDKIQETAQELRIEFRDIVKEIKADQKDMRSEQKVMLVQQTQILTILKGMKKDD